MQHQNSGIASSLVVRKVQAESLWQKKLFTRCQNPPCFWNRWTNFQRHATWYLVMSLFSFMKRRTGFLSLHCMHSLSSLFWILSVRIRSCAGQAGVLRVEVFDSSWISASSQVLFSTLLPKVLSNHCKPMQDQRLPPLTSQELHEIHKNLRVGVFAISMRLMDVFPFQSLIKQLQKK